MNNEKIQEKLLEKKIDGYSSNTDINFKVDGEILVTITIKEYRALITKAVRYDTNNEEYRKDYIKMFDEKQELEKKVKSLQDKILNNLGATDEEDEEDEVLDYE